MANVMLLPCPFCGNEVAWKSGKIRCDYCNLDYAPFLHATGREEQEKAWNTRAKQPTVTVVSEFQPRSEYICQVIDLVAELAQEQDGAVLCHPQEPIVRCKDCKWHGEDEQTGIVYYCKWWGRCVETEPNGFCAWGERVEGSEDETS